MLETRPALRTWYSYPDCCLISNYATNKWKSKICLIVLTCRMAVRNPWGLKKPVIQKTYFIDKYFHLALRINKIYFFVAHFWSICGYPSAELPIPLEQLGIPETQCSRFPGYLRISNLKTHSVLVNLSRIRKLFINFFLNNKTNSFGKFTIHFVTHILQFFKHNRVGFK